jgi:hypothetical protein
MKTGFIISMLFALILINPKGIWAQCAQYPADCPSDRQLPDSADRFGNPLVPEEVSMELRLHDFFTSIAQELADKKKWDVYQYDETDGSGYLNSDRSGPLVFNLRPPHDYEISFIFIVNKDSLAAWKEWTRELASQMQEEADKMKAGMKIDVSSMQANKKKKDNEFRNACMIRVKIGINQETAIASSIEEDSRLTRQLDIPHAVVAFQIHNDKTDDRALFDLDQFKRCTDLAFVLFGSWNPKPNSYKRYEPSYASDKKNIDLVTPKKFTCDKIRSMVIHVEGAPKYIDQFFNSVDWEGLTRIILK